MHRSLGMSLIVAALTGLAGAAGAQVGADLNVSPKRVVFSQSERSSTVFVYNRGALPSTYGIELIDRVMTPDGNIRTLEDVAKDPVAAAYALSMKSAKPMLVYTPRRITLGPNESQTVRIRLLRPAGLPEGEYRTTLTVTAIPPENAGFTAEQASSKPSGEISMRVVGLFSIAIPVIVRQGEREVTLTMSGVRLERNSIAVSLHRGGSASLYGDVEVHRNAPNGELIGFVKGLGVYSEIPERSVTVPLTGTTKPGEKIAILFRDGDLKPGTILASETMVVP